MRMFGELVGAGQAGFVFEKASNPNHYYKIVPLADKPLAEYGLNSVKAKQYAVNQNQALLFHQLFRNKTLDLPQLPKIHNFFQGSVNSTLRQNFLQNNDIDNPHLTTLLKHLPVGQKIAVWEMEKIPCLTENDYCNQYNALPANQNPDYQNLLTSLLDLGFVVRDVANPENFGYRTDGTQVFFDPIVAAWPITEADKFLRPELYDNFVSAFGVDQIRTVARALDNKDYYTWYHGGGVMESEETEESDLPSDVDFEELYSELLHTALWDNKQYPVLETLNWFNPTYQKMAQEQAEQFWAAYYLSLDEMLGPFVDDLNMIAAEETIHDTLWKVEELIYNYYAEITPENIISKTDTLAKELTKLETYDEDVWYDWEQPMFSNGYGYAQATFSNPTVFFKARDKAFQQTIKNRVGEIELQCGECDGKGVITHSHDDYDKEYNEWCDSCSEGTVTVGEI